MRVSNFIMTVSKYIRFYGGSYKCIVCSKPVRLFFHFSTSLEKNAKSNGFPYDFRRMETLNYEQCNCPFCLSSDRERLYLLYLEKFLVDNNKYSVLDFAPTPLFASTLRKMSHHYVSTDYVRDDVDVKMNICNMNVINDASFDFVICSHILEHVPDPDKAMREILRIMRSGGKAIIMVPLFWDVENTVEDASHNTDELRLKYYGQEDHVRLFSKKDFLNCLTKAGFKVEQLEPSDFDELKVKENAISSNSILYVCSKDERK